MTTSTSSWSLLRFVRIKDLDAGREIDYRRNQTRHISRLESGEREIEWRERGEGSLILSFVLFEINIKHHHHPPHLMADVAADLASRFSELND